MTDPQPHHLKPKPPRAEPLQPDKPGAGDERLDEDAEPDIPARRAEARAAAPPEAPSPVIAPGPTSQQKSMQGASQQIKAMPMPSPEAAIPRDDLTNQAIDDPSLESGDESKLPDGRSGSMHLPES